MDKIVTTSNYPPVKFNFFRQNFSRIFNFPSEEKVFPTRGSEMAGEDDGRGEGGQTGQLGGHIVQDPGWAPGASPGGGKQR